MKNFDYCKYTYVHRRVIELLAKKYIKDEEVLNEVLKRVKIHDMDKMVLYLLWPKKQASEYHRAHAAHHIQNDIPKDKLDLIETCLDYDSARYSKPDKPLPCKETVDSLFPEYKQVLYPIMDYLGINKDNLPVDEDILNYIQELSKNVTEEDIYNEVMLYLTTCEDNVYKELFL